MDKKLLNKLSGFNLSMQQKTQLIELMKNVGGNKNNIDSNEEHPIYVDFSPDGSYECTLHICIKECFKEVIDLYLSIPDNDLTAEYIEQQFKLNNYYVPVRFERGYETEKSFICDNNKLFELWYIYTHLLKNKTDLKITYAIIRETDNPLVFDYYPSVAYSIWTLKQCQYSVGGDLITAPDVVEKTPLICNATFSIDYNNAETLQLIPLQQ